MGWHNMGERVDRKRWAKIRTFCLDRDGWRCVKCGHRGRLECDHIVSMFNGGDFYNVDNVQVLCRDCHFAKTRQENIDAGEDELPEDVKDWKAISTKSVNGIMNP